MTEEYAVEINGLTKTFGQQTAVDQVSFNIKRGEVFGLLGPNGAGKTTTLRMMTTLLQPTSGDIKIFGHDVKTESQTVRSLFGLTGQYASVDEDISARENLMIFSRLNGLSRQEAKVRTTELLEEFSLVNSADKAISNFSGGMRRRLDLAVSLITRPALIFLDEPTTGLDPRTRTQMWDTIRQLVAAGSTIVLTTQYLEEADELADRIAVIDHGKLVSIGTPAELKAQVGGAKLRVEVADDAQAEQARGVMADTLPATPQVTRNVVEVAIDDINTVAGVLQAITAAGVTMTNMSVEQPSMDDVFFALTVGKN
ncbi:ATP-binding cassette domain-containing protein [Weissella cibaria]|jgi:daunorubicin resistance ABC transporter ATP-binding subunit|uniref:ATP-binding cassette domain-containing protein n=1 Tax=Weissella cibaria TaxID=137591 RepID=UPI000E48D6C7|nr:ATP-binding cassette domain-containing protein [Weissella cibaria]MBZ6068941.1 ATP-binding cassette domain-containing protein [Weissella cibaria]MCQ9618943.1 ATP-binding cassette domain-containing protein [Weissella cibaria]MCT8398298.1 ATP-binding cassette domain-containing protein [Weissella cibaria]MCT8401494.1 ATP-binding cassette domain-containing protein [Weissella cibaria]QAT26453.1 ATP-binding cassette domain-containing protein [Weissella cibaria]